MQAVFFPKYFLPICAAFLMFLLPSCSTSGILQTSATQEFGISQHNQIAPYIPSPENALTPDLPSENKIESLQSLPAKPAARKTFKQFTQQHKGKVNTVLKKVKKLAPDTRNLTQSAAKKWKPGRDSFNVTLKDVVFMIVLLALLALLGGLIHNIFGLSLTLSLVITMGIGFVVICIYLWYLFNY